MKFVSWQILPAFALAVGVWWILRPVFVPPNAATAFSHKRIQPDSGSDPSFRGTFADVSARAKANGATGTAGKLADLKLRWAAMPARMDAQDRAEITALAEETVRALAYSEALAYLIEHLRTHAHAAGLCAITTALAELRTSDEAPEARRTLAKALPSDQSRRCFEEWIYRAALRCPPEDFDAFHNSIGDPGMKQEALFGRNYALARTEPAGALTSTLEQLAENVASLNSEDFLSALLSTVPPDSCFFELEELLSKASEPESPRVAEARSELYKRWGQANFEEVTHHLLENPRRLPPRLMQDAVEGVFLSEGEKSIGLIESIPDGPHFDAAAAFLLGRLSQTGLERFYLLVPRIQDQQLRRMWRDELNAQDNRSK